jgi:8-oxo-dGTP pyrophosphatase MutT (NUDIX family)
LIILRERAGTLETLLLRRPTKVDFSGMCVFPGGKLEETDRALLPRMRGAPALSPEEAVLRAAAIRETFEECGLLYARRAGEDRLVTGAFETARRALAAGTGSFLQMLEEEKLELAGDLIRPVSRWVTPWWQKRRFDTYFFMAEAPAGQEPCHENYETLETLWLSPRAARDAASEKRIRLARPTVVHLERLEREGSWAAALAMEDAAALHAPIHPWLNEEDGAYVLGADLPEGYHVPPRRIAKLTDLDFDAALAAQIEAALKRG